MIAPVTAFADETIDYNKVGTSQNYQTTNTQQTDYTQNTDRNKPTKIDGNNTYEYDSNNEKATNYATNLKVIDKSGHVIPTYKYKITSTDRVAGPGYYDVETTFTRDLANYKPLSTKIKIIPKTPSLIIDGSQIYKRAIKIFVIGNEKLDYDIVQIYYSRDPVFKNAKVKSFRYKEVYRCGGATSTGCMLTGLKYNTQYYIKVRLEKTVGNDIFYSNFAIARPHTAKSVPKFSINNKHVKSIICKMKKNKSFTYVFKSHYNKTALMNLYSDIKLAYPQYACRYNSIISSSEDGNSYCKLKCTIKKNKIKKGKQLERKINAIARKANRKGSRRNKVKYIDDYLCNTCRYDYDLYYHHRTNYNHPSYSLYGCLIKHKAVCQGYAEAFKAIATKCRIPNKLVYSTSHVWNKVKIGSRWYHVDSTWNDCSGNKKYLLKKRHG